MIYKLFKALNPWGLIWHTSPSDVLPLLESWHLRETSKEGQGHCFQKPPWWSTWAKNHDLEIRTFGFVSPHCHCFKSVSPTQSIDSDSAELGGAWDFACFTKTHVMSALLIHGTSFEWQDPVWPWMSKSFIFLSASVSSLLWNRGNQWNVLCPALWESNGAFLGICCLRLRMQSVSFGQTVRGQGNFYKG